MVAKLKRKAASTTEPSKPAKVEAVEAENVEPVPSKKVKKVAKSPKGSQKSTEKKVKTEATEVKPKKEESTPMETGGYVAGGLSGLFGKSSSAEEVAAPSAPITTGETKIVPKVKQVKEVKVKPEGRDAQRENRKKQKMTGDEKKRTVFVGNMPVSYNEKDVRKMFVECGAVESVRIRGIIPTSEKLTKRVAHITGEMSEKQKSVYFYVKFKEEAAVAEALKKNGEAVEGHRIRVDKVSGKREYDKGHTIYIGNLPFAASEDDISAFFEKEVGPVDFTRVVHDPATGKGKGYAFVYFKEAASLDLALGMVGIEFQGRALRITKMLKKGQLLKQKEAMKKKGKGKKGEEKKQPSKIDKFKFSTRKTKPSTASEKPRLKKSAKKAIHKKKNAGKKTLMK